MKRKASAQRKLSDSIDNSQDVNSLITDESLNQSFANEEKYVNIFQEAMLEKDKALNSKKKIIKEQTKQLDRQREIFEKCITELAKLDISISSVDEIPTAIEGLRETRSKKIEVLMKERDDLRRKLQEIESLNEKNTAAADESMKSLITTRGKLIQANRRIADIESESTSTRGNESNSSFCLWRILCFASRPKRRQNRS